jgi:hypothetical protein
MSPFTNLLIILVIAGIVFVAWRFRLQKIEESLLDNPPERRIIEVSLPLGTKKSSSEMVRFYRKISTAALGDKKAREKGMRQIDFVYLVDAQSEGATPRMRCRIYADPDQMDAVKKALKSSFTDWVDVMEVEEDELRMLAEQLRPRPNVEDPAEIELGEQPELEAGEAPPELEAGEPESPKF